jgi:uncharacterized membrane protein YphA (DoxX/SURF4 family)
MLREEYSEVSIIDANPSLQISELSTARDPDHSLESTAARREGRDRAMAIVRIAFGLVIAVDAWFKWQPSFVHGFTNYLKSATDGQPQVVKDWINLVIHVMNINPHLFARVLALGETGVAIGLIFGVFTNTTCLIGALLTATIWSTAEGFGGPYKAGSTDVGAAIIYVFVFAALLISHAGRTWGLDRRLGDRLGRWSFLCSGRG